MTRNLLQALLKASLIAVFAASVVTFSPTDTHAGSATRLRAEKKLGSKASAAFVKKMTVEMDIVLYPIISLPHAQAWREDMMKRFGARGSMKRKTRKQIAEMFKADARVAFTEAEISDQIVAAVDRLVAAEESRK